MDLISSSVKKEGDTYSVGSDCEYLHTHFYALKWDGESPGYLVNVVPEEHTVSIFRAEDRNSMSQPRRTTSPSSPP
jgi:hypothetical protein